MALHAHPPARMTAARFEASPLAQTHELSNGEVIEMAPVGGFHGEVQVNLAVLLKQFVKANGLGRVVVESGFRLSADTVRAPDVAFVAGAERLPDGYIDGAPDLAIEVVSPGDTYAALELKLEQYFQAGTTTVWVVSPVNRRVAVHDGPVVHIRRAEDTLSGGDVLPGFECLVADVFDG